MAGFDSVFFPNGSIYTDTHVKTVGRREEALKCGSSVVNLDQSSVWLSKRQIGPVRVTTVAGETAPFVSLRGPSGAHSWGAADDDRPTRME